MGTQLTCTGQIVVAPSLSTEATFPAGSSIVPFQTNPSPKCAAVSTGDLSFNVESPSSFVALPGVGSSGAVTQATFLFLRTAGTMTFRTTTYNVAGNVLAVETVNGMKIVEYDPGAYLVLVEAQGGGQVEMLATGSQ